MTCEKVASIEDVDIGGSIRVEAGGEPIALVRIAADTVKAVHNVCSHQHYDLAPEGLIGENSIECALHGSTFNLDSGVPESLPAVDPIPVYACKVEDGAVFVDTDQQLNDAAIPRHR